MSIAYHKTLRDYEWFDLGKTELGLHVGSLDLLEHFAEGLTERAILWEIEFSPREAVRLTDKTDWDTYEVTDRLRSLRVLDVNDVTDIYETKDYIEASEVLREILVSHGIDAIVYLNRCELPPVNGIVRRADQPVRMKLSDEEFLLRYPEAKDCFIILNLDCIKKAVPQVIVDDSI
jgi:hypothetical protein